MSPVLLLATTLVVVGFGGGLVLAVGQALFSVARARDLEGPPVCIAA